MLKVFSSVLMYPSQHFDHGDGGKGKWSQDAGNVCFIAITRSKGFRGKS